MTSRSAQRLAGFALACFSAVALAGCAEHGSAGGPSLAPSVDASALPDGAFIDPLDGGFGASDLAGTRTLWGSVTFTSAAPCDLNGLCSAPGSSFFSPLVNTIHRFRIVLRPGTEYAAPFAPASTGIRSLDVSELVWRFEPTDVILGALASELSGGTGTMSIGDFGPGTGPSLVVDPGFRSPTFEVRLACAASGMAFGAGGQALWSPFTFSGEVVIHRMNGSRITDRATATISYGHFE